MSNDIGSHDPKSAGHPNPPWAQSAPRTGVLVAHVYRDGTSTIYLAHSGDADGLELDAEVSAGGDWEEALVIYEDGPPMPPNEDGLWEMRYPWRTVTEADFSEDGEATGLDRDLCCLYTASPQWTLLVPALAGVPAND